jgi:hypothetical protein
MLRLRNPRIFIPAAILYAILIFYLSITSDIGNIRHIVNITLIHGVRDILIAINIPFVLRFLVGSVNFAEKQSIDIGHVGIYFMFDILLYLAFVSSKNQIFKKHSAASAVCLGTAYGILNEIFQLYLPYRTASVGDAFSNLMGLVLAQFLVVSFIFVLRQIQNWKKKTERSVS